MSANRSVRFPARRIVRCDKPEHDGLMTDTEAVGAAAGAIPTDRPGARGRRNGADPAAAHHVLAPPEQTLASCSSWQRALAELELAFSGPGAAVVTLTGVPGVGKSTLARGWVAARDGDVVSASLAGASSRPQIAQRLAAALGLSFARPVPALPELVLGAQGRILCLDDADHAVETLASVVRDALDARAGAWPGLLVTSREPIRLRGERVIVLERPPQIPAVALFLAACRAFGARLSGSAAELADAHAIVALLDRVPLALEIAAAHARVVSLAILRRSLASGAWVPSAGLRGGAPHHTSLERAVMWSVGRITPDERASLEALCVFEGSFDLAAYRAVVAATDDRDDDALYALVQRSLVQVIRGHERAELRFAVPRPVRDIVMRQASPSLPTRERHAQWYRQLGHELALRLPAAAPPASADRIIDDYHNIIAARREHCSRCGELETCPCAANGPSDVDPRALACPRVDPGGGCAGARPGQGAATGALSCASAGDGKPRECEVLVGVASLISALHETACRPGCQLPAAPACRASADGARFELSAAGRGFSVPGAGVGSRPRAADVRRLEVATDGTSFRGPAGSVVDLSRRPVLAQLLKLLAEARLAAPGTPVPVVALLESVWGQAPGSHPRSRVGRLYIAIARLRTMGLQDHLHNVGGGYLLDSAVPLVWSAPQGRSGSIAS